MTKVLQFRSSISWRRKDARRREIYARRCIDVKSENLRPKIHLISRLFFSLSPCETHSPISDADPNAHELFYSLWIILLSRMWYIGLCLWLNLHFIDQTKYLLIRFYSLLIHLFLLLSLGRRRNFLSIFEKATRWRMLQMHVLLTAGISFLRPIDDRIESNPINAISSSSV